MPAKDLRHARRGIRSRSLQSKRPPKDPHYIEKISKACRINDEVIHRIISTIQEALQESRNRRYRGWFSNSQPTTNGCTSCSYKDLFSVRLGVLKFRGFVLNPKRIPYTPGQPLKDGDFYPDFEQKGVDMRISTDIANLSSNKSVELIAPATNDTGCIPAMKHARRSGLQIALVGFTGFRPAPELLAHSDFRREIQWPT